MSRCCQAWKLYDDWCDVTSRLTQATKPQEVLTLKTLDAYLEETLRDHYRTCKKCQKALSEFVEASNEFNNKRVASGISTGDNRP